MSATDDERELRINLMQTDLELRRKQVAWETPRNIAILAGSVAAVTAAIAGTVGYKIGSQAPQTINVHLGSPLLVQPPLAFHGLPPAEPSPTPPAPGK